MTAGLGGVWAELGRWARDPIIAVLGVVFDEMCCVRKLVVGLPVCERADCGRVVLAAPVTSYVSTI